MAVVLQRKNLSFRLFIFITVVVITSSHLQSPAEHPPGRPSKCLRFTHPNNFMVANQFLAATEDERYENGA